MTPPLLRRALISVSDKTGIVALCRRLAHYQIEIVSTGGTAELLRSEGLSVTDVSTHTGFPEIMDGRVKTLHPLVHGGLLGRRDNPAHIEAMKTHAIQPIDLVIVNLYPFRQTVQAGASKKTCIENIDIGGPSMIRSAAKNYEFVTILTDPEDYPAFLAELEAKQGSTSLSFREAMAGKAFSHTALYDATISNWFNREQRETFPPLLVIPALRNAVLRYGENAHQAAAVYSDPLSYTPGIPQATQHQGKELSYNNINDANSAWEIVNSFALPTVAIIKHANPCGVASAETGLDAYNSALAADPKSAFGGIIACNHTVDKKTANRIIEHFFEVLVAPDVTLEALESLAKKPNMRVLTLPLSAHPIPAPLTVHSITGGFLLQESDGSLPMQEDLTCVSKRTPSEAILEELRFAMTVCKYVKSNAIVVSAGQQTLGIGAGQMSRVDAVKIACDRYASFRNQLPSETIAVLASDAFFPFTDGLEIAASYGIQAIVQPAGSIRDHEIIAKADELGMILMHTRHRHFRH